MLECRTKTCFPCTPTVRTIFRSLNVQHVINTDVVVVLTSGGTIDLLTEYANCLNGDLDDVSVKAQRCIHAHFTGLL